MDSMVQGQIQISPEKKVVGQKSSQNTIGSQLKIFLMQNPELAKVYDPEKHKVDKLSRKVSQEPKTSILS